MPKQINTYKVGQSLVRMFALKGRYQPVLDETIVPVVVVGEEPTPEAIPGFGTVICAASGGGNQNLAMFSNPPTSNRLIVLDKFAVSTPAADFVELRVVTAAGGNPTQRRDLRTVEPSALLVRVALAAVALGPFQWQTDLLQTWIDIGMYLTPGNAFQVRQNAGNSTMEVSYLFREFLDPGGTLNV